MPKILDISYAGELGAANYILGIRDGKAVRFPVSVFEDEPVVNSSFTALTDTPADYVDQAGKLAAVNSTETGLEFIDAPTSLPAGGAAGQVLTKNSATEGDAGWEDAVSSFLGLSDTPDSYSAYVGKVVAVKADGSGLEFISPTSGSYTIVDLSSATTDYTLSPGEVAKITYSEATSVPLHIATQEGVYELLILANPILTTCVDGAGHLNPNNTTYSGVISRQYHNAAGTTITSGVVSSDTGFLATAHRLINSKLRVVTFTTAKQVSGELAYLNSTAVHSIQHYSAIWSGSTVWSSLGTITFANAQSGTIIIKRIA